MNASAADVINFYKHLRNQYAATWSVPKNSPASKATVDASHIGVDILDRYAKSKDVGVLERNLPEVLKWTYTYLNFIKSQQTEEAKSIDGLVQAYERIASVKESFSEALIDSLYESRRKRLKLRKPSAHFRIKPIPTQMAALASNPDSKGGVDAPVLHGS